MRVRAILASICVVALVGVAAELTRAPEVGGVKAAVPERDDGGAGRRRGMIWKPRLRLASRGEGVSLSERG
jgi:hypothetical protein